MPSSPVVFDGALPLVSAAAVPCGSGPPYDPGVRAAATSALTLRISDLALRPLVSCDTTASIVDVAARMTAADTASAITLDSSGRPTGIVTDSDLRRRVAARGRPLSDSVREIMSSPVVTIERDALGLDAVQAMLEARIHHLVVVDNQGRALSVVADSDLLAQEAADPLLLARRMERANSIEELAEARSRYAITAELLLDAGARPSAIGRILAEANDRLQRRLLRLARDQLGPAPARFAWVVMGSEGRRIQTLKTDQDNGLIWEDVPGAETYFGALGAWMVDALARCGVPRCAGDVMATNPLWRGTDSEWRRRFAAWLGEPEPVPLLRALVAFDLRAAAGSGELVAALRTWLMERTPHARILLAHIARELGQRRVALGPLGRFRLRAGAIDAKMDAIGVAVDGARLLALDLGIPETSTLGRLGRAAELGAVPRGDAAEVSEAYEGIQELRFRRQVAQVQRGILPDNSIVPAELSRAHRAALREYLDALARFQRGVGERFGLAGQVA
jgi:CBS domain-containing protein